MKSKTTADLPSLRELLAAGAHFGHRKEWSTPASKEYTFVIRDGVCVINLEETQTRLNDVMHYLEEQASRGASILLVGTKRQASEIVKKIGSEQGILFVHQRWLGGTLTNFTVIRSNIQRLAELEQTLGDDQAVANMTKREIARLTEQAKKLHTTLDGITAMTKLPDILLVIDPTEEATAIREAKTLGIPVVAICDTDADPALFNHFIPANDDAPKTIELLLTHLGKAISRGKQKMSNDKAQISNQIKNPKA
jgi:small subunit ribosomal protein S2